ncbi:MAG: CopD family protein, partial [Propionibacteriaceae bacterium]|nr:CopD family protein [Propionibacteriaceae bacterium]
AGGSALLIPATAVRGTGGQPWETLWPPGWLAGLSWQPVIAAVVIAAAGLAARWASRRPDTIGRLTLPLAVVALAGPSLVGHTRTTTPTWLMLAADLGHLLAASIWLGGVLGLSRQLWRTHRRTPPPDQATLRALARTVARFSGFALAGVGLLAVSGLVMGTLVVGSLDALPGTAYGRTLLLKTGIVGPLLAIAAWNRFVLLPRLTRTPTSRPHWELLTRTLRNEAALLIAVVAVTGMLTNTNPGHAEGHRSGGEATAIPLDADSQGLRVIGTLTPGATGVNRLSFTLAYRGEPQAIDQVGVSARLPEQELGPLQATPLLDPATGEYTTQLTLPAAGRWQLQISARVDAFAKPVVLIELPVE